MGIVVVSTGVTIARRPDPSTGKLVRAATGEELGEMLGVGLDPAAVPAVETG